MPESFSKLPSDHAIKVLILLGPPGSGKGTQAKLLENKLGLPHISTGDLLRDHIQRNTSLGVLAKSYIEKGNLAPDTLILDVLFERISQGDCQRGYILDGVPRTISQAEILQKHLGEKIHPLVINLYLSDEKVLERLSKRIVCERCGAPYHLIYTPPEVEGICNHCKGKLVHRSDDSEPVIRRRLEVYKAQTAPLIAFYTEQGLLHTVDCSVTKEEVFFQILLVVKK